MTRVTNKLHLKVPPSSPRVGVPKLRANDANFQWPPKFLFNRAQQFHHGHATTFFILNVGTSGQKF